MSHSNRIYLVFKPEDVVAAKADKYVSNSSKVVGWACGKVKGSRLSSYASKTLPDFAPQSVKDYFEANNHQLDEKHAQLLVGVEASSKDSLDGWWFVEDL